MLKALRKNVSNLQNEISVCGLDVSQTQLFKAICKYFVQDALITKRELLKTSLEIFAQKYVDDDGVDVVERTIQGYNLVGRMLRHKNDEGALQSFVKSIQKLQLRNYEDSQEIRSFVEQIFFAGYSGIALQHYSQKHTGMRQRVRKFHTYLQQNYDASQQLKNYQMRTNWVFDKTQIDNWCTENANKDKVSYRQMTALRLHKEYTKPNSQSWQTYLCYQLIQYLLSITDRQFLHEFSITNSDTVELATKLFKESRVVCLNDLKIKVAIMSHIEFSQLNIDFSSSFGVQNVPDDIIIKMLDNTDNRLQLVWGTQYFIFIRRVSDNKILRLQIDENSNYAPQLNRIVQECQDGELYDVIIRAPCSYDNLGQIRIRSLNYVNKNIAYEARWRGGFQLKLKLNHPEDLVSLNSSRVIIVNIDQCTNLRNLYSSENEYGKKDTDAFRNLQRIYSYTDVYQTASPCFARELFKQNKLEYAFIIKNGYDYTIFNSMNISQNIINLRYLYMSQDMTRNHDIVVDLSNEFPRNLCYCYIKIGNSDIILRCPENNKQQLRKQLMCCSCRIQ